MSDIFCNLPFTDVHIGINGVASPCCVFKSKSFNTIDRYLIGDELKQVKNSFINGKFPSQCQECEKNENVNGTSFRLVSQNFNSKESDIRLAGPDFSNITHVSIVSSNICNLKCLPCYDGSNIRTKELINLNLKKYNKVIKIKNLDTNYINKISNIKTLNKLTLSGGEPFFDKVTFELINRLIEVGLAKNIFLDINTNLTLVTSEKIEFLQNNFKNVLIKGSIDGIGITNNYLRYPSKWEEITKNIDSIRRTNCEFIVTTAMSNLALMNYVQLIEWALENNIIDLFQSVVTDVPELIPTNLPKDIKMNLLEKFRKISYQVTSDRMKSVVDSCITMCQNPVDYDITKTIEYLKKHDDIRGTSYSMVWPELLEYE